MYLKLEKVKVGTWMKRGIPEITININNIKTLTCTCITETFKSLYRGNSKLTGNSENR